MLFFSCIDFFYTLDFIQIPFNPVFTGGYIKEIFDEDRYKERCC
jgi:hypothetical protein